MRYYSRSTQNIINEEKIRKKKNFVFFEQLASGSLFSPSTETKGKKQKKANIESDDVTSLLEDISTKRVYRYFFFFFLSKRRDNNEKKQVLLIFLTFPEPEKVLD